MSQSDSCTLECLEAQRIRIDLVTCRCVLIDQSMSANLNSLTIDNSTDGYLATNEALSKCFDSSMERCVINQLDEIEKADTGRDGQSSISKRSLRDELVED